MTKLQIKLLSDNATKPKRADDESAGYDIYAAETVILEPQQKALVATDLAVNIPKGYVGLLTSRSGVSSKTHLVVETGKIDAGFQGHMKINIKNNYISLEQYDGAIMDVEDGGLIYPVYGIDEETKYFSGKIDTPVYKINKGDRLAQLVIVPIWTPELETVEEFESETARGQNGFGSSGTR
ncbi:dUTP diphosphatase [Staphylococcus saprophyticus]|uniref:dUTP diphosphatase n=1 Tax=Staphylococcus saprophyticus TaxID=29385 RepID=UPI0034DDBAD5